MRAFDTNVVVRVLVRDDERQTEIARQAWAAAVSSGGAFLSKVVLAETVWVLRSAFKLDRATITGALRSLVSLSGSVVEDEPEILAALDAYATGPADFSDYLVRESARGAGALPLVTFDVDLGSEGDVDLLPHA